MSSEVGGDGGSDALRSIAGADGGALAAAARRAIACCRAAKTSLVGSPVSRAPRLRWKLRVAVRGTGPIAPSGLSPRGFSSNTPPWVGLILALAALGPP